MESNSGDTTENLITSVQERPALYNNKLREFLDRSLKEHLWQEVSESVVSNWRLLTPEERINKVREVQSRWQNLRTCFKRELKAQKRELCSPVTKRRRKYVYFDQMSFLLPCYDDSDIDSYPVNVMPQHYDVKTEPFLEDITIESDVRSTHSLYEQEHHTGDFEITNNFRYIQNTANSPAEGNVSAETRTQRFVATEGSGHERRLANFVRNEQGESGRSTESLIYREREKTEDDVVGELEDKKIHSRIKQPANVLSCFEESVVAILKQKINEDIDEDKAFLLSLLPMFKKFSDDQKLDAKIEILRVMRNINKSLSESETHM